MDIPSASNIQAPLPDVLPALPKSWSALTWRQLCDCWTCKVRYGGNADVARAAALLALTFGSRFKVQGSRVDDKTGEPVYYLKPATCNLQPETRNLKPATCNLKPETYAITPRELAHMAKQAMPWFDYPYGDSGKEAVKDDNGKVIEEAVAPVRGYVSDMRDALILPSDYVAVSGFKIQVSGEGGSRWRSYLKLETWNLKPAKHFALPQLACNNLTWQQYRSLQAIEPQLFKEGNTEDETLDLWAQFLAHCLVPRSLALLDTNGGSIRFRPHWEYTYDSVRAEGLVAWWRKKLAASSSRHNDITVSRQDTAVILFHICFQAYQTALSYYAQVFPLLFNGGGKSDPMQDALKGETQTLNAVMKYQGYTKPEDVYAENLPIILSTLNTMAEEAKQIEQMNARIKRK